MTRENGSSSLPGQVLGEIDLVGGPFAVVESDPGVFTALIRKLGVRGIEVAEVYDIQPWGLDHLRPKALVLCFTWRHDKHNPRDFRDPAAKDIWFANQLVDDACASLAILNVLFNCPDVDLGDNLAAFKADTTDMSPKMKGLAITNNKQLRETQNSLARPADLWGSLSAIAVSTRDASPSKKPAKKRTKTAVVNSSPRRKPSAKKRKAAIEEETPETYHFIGYVPAHGKVWELDGLKSGPLEVGELPSADCINGWENVVRPALRLKMQKYGGGGGAITEEGGNIQFNLLALVQDRYEIKSDELELLKRERATLERRLAETYGNEWRCQVDEDLLNSADDSFITLGQSLSPSQPFAKDFGARKMEKDFAILQMSPENLTDAWQTCIRRAMPVKIAIDEELQSAIQARCSLESSSV
ncbi:hypothetical protein EW145_g1667 [Phellinidium pouzarii]|uniref:ubiquitinyl hydrolase 1 n=1 Tax=Phellinidium pouzarii TaxID=167371 RepID=A0A4S4LFK5_9AGAM|nr:hypothetical protein EW145_g1667 [Phellinidium pouzarii]